MGRQAPVVHLAAHRAPAQFTPSPRTGASGRPQAISALLRSVRILITGTGRKRLHTLKAISHSDETGRPCLAIMLPDED
jgi:hypothetical protein